MKRPRCLIGQAVVLVVVASTMAARTAAFSSGPVASSFTTTASDISSTTNRRIVLNRRHRAGTTSLAVGFAPDLMSVDDIISTTEQQQQQLRKKKKNTDVESYIYQQQQQQLQVTPAAADGVVDDSWLTSFLLPVLSSALLITGNTVGAGCLVLPELVAAGPGLLGASVIFMAAWAVNIVSAFILAEVAITQKENAGEAVPSSFQEFAQVNLGSRPAGLLVSGLSFFVNACVLSFDLSRAGSVGGQLTGLPVEAQGLFSTAVAMALVTAMSTLSIHKLSSISTVCVGMLFLSLGGLLIPGLAGVSDVVGTILQPGLAPEFGPALSECAPIILMSMVFQNIVPTVTKLHDYDRTKTAASIVLGSFLPLVMDLSWCLACLGGGIDTTTLGTSGSLMTVFSIATLGGSGLCGAVSLAEELETLQRPTTTTTTGGGDIIQPPITTAAPAFRVTSSLAAISLPLAAAVLLNNDGEGLTGALSLAGSFGSPLLYGAIPAVMAWRQQQQQQGTVAKSRQQQRPTMDLAPAAALPILGSLSVGYVGQELVAMTQEVLAFI
jgi:tyrosine-specific transport protein